MSTEGEALAGEDFKAVWHSLQPYGCDDTLRAMIVKTLTRVPDEVREFALTRCSFVSIPPETYGMVWPARIAGDADDYLVVLNTPFIKDDDEPLSIIAHEIAHAWLGHDRLSLESTVEWERDAAETAAEWGFDGKGSDPDFCLAPYEDVGATEDEGTP